MFVTNIHCILIHSNYEKNTSTSNNVQSHNSHDDSSHSSSPSSSSSSKSIDYEDPNREVVDDNDYAAKMFAESEASSGNDNSIFSQESQKDNEQDSSNSSDDAVSEGA